MFIHAHMTLLRLRSSEGQFATSREIEPERRSLRRHGSSTFVEAARLVPSSISWLSLSLSLSLYIYIYVYTHVAN